MGLQSALTTSLTGLQAAETVIDVVGNNVANSSTVGFKESKVLFANQFLQTQTIGSAPTDSTGGTNPRQIGLGVKVSAINPNFTQGTIQISANPLDVAIQGDGFLLVQGSQGEPLYTRNGQLQTNSQNEVVNATGNRILGNSVDEDFNIIFDSTNPVPITIPLGVPVAQETTNAVLSGNLSPNTAVGTSGILESEPLGDGTVEYPNSMGVTFDNGDFGFVIPPDTFAAGTVAVEGGAAGTGLSGDYDYRFTWFKTTGGQTYETAPSSAISITGVTLDNQIDLNNLPTEDPMVWDGMRIYRSDGGNFELLDTVAADAGMYPDDGSATPDPLVTLSTSALDQEEYSYYVTFYQSGGLNIESRPTQLIGPFSVSGTSSRIRIDNLPQPTDPMFDQVRIYRNTGASSTRFLLVDTLDAGVTTYIDSKSDIAIDVLEAKEIDLLGARATNTTKLVDVVIRNGDQYIPAFVEGTLSFNGRKGGRTLSAKELTIDGDPVTGTNVNDLRLFMQQAFGMDTSQQDVGSTTTNGVLRFTSNVGIENELSVSLNAFQITQDDGSTVPVSLGFDVTTDATGEGSTTTFVVFDALGQPVNVRMTTARVDSAPGVAGATYKWFVTSEDTQPDGVSVNTFVASGDLVFDLQGNIVQPDNGIEEISIDRTSDLTFNLDFSSVSGLTVTNAQGQPVSTMNLQRQDGFPTGTLTSFTITESGLIRGVFSNGAERALGQLLMAKFANTTGLQQVGNNLFTKGINSGEPITNIPGAEGIGTLTAGAVELSNTDIGQNLIQLILASTQYRGGARVITTTQQLLDELLNLRR